MSEVLHEPWDSPRRQREAAQFGTWVFLGSEAMLFGGLFLAFAVNRWLHPAGFAAAGRETDVVLGTANTLLLLASSAAMAVGSEAARAGLRRLALRGMAAVLLLGAGFLALKGFEWSEDLRRNLWPGDGFRLAEPGARLFFGLYWVTTALHALHLAGGPGAATARCRAPPSRPRRCTGIWWMWSGSSSTRCSTWAAGHE